MYAILRLRVYLGYASGCWQDCSDAKGRPRGSTAWRRRCGWNKRFVYKKSAADSLDGNCFLS